MLDYLIRDGTVVDGSGSPGERADVGIRDGRIVEIGRTDEAAARTIDAEGCVVSPGFVDIHTHYDAQLFWDSAATPSPFHGVTTVVGGNCGFTIAPLAEDGADYLMRMMARVEGMPLAALQAGLTWDWTSYSDWLDRLDGHVVPNVGFLVGHSAIRRLVMREDAVGNEASSDQIEQMVRTLHEALAAGGLGFSSSLAQSHNDGDGNPVPSRAATRDELLAMAAAVRDHSGTTIEFIPRGVRTFSDADIDLMTALSLAADRPLNWNLLRVESARSDAHLGKLVASDRAAAAGARVHPLMFPGRLRIRLNFVTGFGFDALPGWSDTFKLSVEDRIAALSDPRYREGLRESARAAVTGNLNNLTRWESYVVRETFDPALAHVEGRSVGDIAAEREADPFDTLLDIAVGDGLRTGLEPPGGDEDDETWRARAALWLDSRTVLGASDAGAHADMMCGAAYPSALLGEFVRDRGLLTLEEAVHQLTDVPARLYGLRERGRLRAGWWADVVIFDPDRIAPDPVRTVKDLPGGAERLFAAAEGVEHVMVNGVEVVQGRKLTGDEPGTLLRSGRDTETVTAGSSA